MQAGKRPRRLAADARVPGQNSLAAPTRGGGMIHPGRIGGPVRSVRGKG